MRFLKFARSGSLALILLVGTITGSAGQDSTDRDRAHAEAEAAFGFVPVFLRVLPDAAVGGAWEELVALEMAPGGATLTPKLRSLVAGAVAAQVPAGAWARFEEANARRHGASEQELAEAMAIAAVTRHWSVVLGGTGTDPDSFRTEADALQIPCRYSVDWHAAAARQEGATRDEIREAIAIAAMTRHWCALTAALDGEDLEHDLKRITEHLDDRAAGRE